jgi:hypothetical protein
VGWKLSCLIGKFRLFSNRVFASLEIHGFYIFSLKKRLKSKFSRKDKKLSKNLSHRWRYNKDQQKLLQQMALSSKYFRENAQKNPHPNRSQIRFDFYHFYADFVM